MAWTKISREASRQGKANKLKDFKKSFPLKSSGMVYYYKTWTGFFVRKRRRGNAGSIPTNFPFEKWFEDDGVDRVMSCQEH